VDKMDNAIIILADREIERGYGMKPCRKCNYYSKDDLTGMSLWDKIHHVSGHCADWTNPDFNGFARTYGRGIKRLDSWSRPKWCNRTGGKA